jgi:hypothetical protein
MLNPLSCPNCRAANAPGARFCTGCGTGLGGQSCSQCGAQLKGGAFCTGCGAPAAAQQPTGPGSVAGGKWERAPGEFVRRVGFEELRQQFDSDLKSDGGFWNMLVNFGQQALQKMQNLYVTIPTGSVAVVMFDGVVTEVLQPGRRAVSGFASALVQRLEATDGENISWWQRVRSSFSQGAGAAVETLLSTRLQRTSIYLFDRRYIPVPYEQQVTGSSDDHALAVSVVASASVSGATDAQLREAYGLFLSRVVGDATSLTQQALHARIQPHVERLTKDAAERLRDASGPNLPRIQAYIAERLVVEFGAAHGLAFDVVVSTRATTLSLRLHLGQSHLPDIRSCVNVSCASEIKFGQRFCVGCGGEQPTATDPARACGGCAAHVPVGLNFCTACGTAYTEVDPRAVRLLTADGEPIELDLVFRAQCDRERKDTTRVVAALAATARGLLRSMQYAETQSPAGIARIEQALVEGVKEALQQLNLQLLGLSVLDVRGRNGEWLLNADAEVRRAEAELDVGREWLRVDGERLGLQGATLELVRQRLRLEQDDRFERAQLQRADALRETLARLGHQLGLDVASLQDREQRQDIAERDATITVADARRDASVNMATDAAEREADRALRDREHEDDVARFEQGAQVDDLQDGRRRTREVGELDHQMGLENRTADHDEARLRREATLSSDIGRQTVDDLVYATQVGLDQAANEAQRGLDRGYVEDQRRQDLALGRQRSEQEILLDRQKAEQALRLEGARVQHDLAQSVADGQHGRDMEALRIASQVQADRERLEMEREQARLRAEAEREQERLRLENERLSGRSGADLLAAQASMLANAEHGGAFAAALAAQTDGSTRLEMMQQMLNRDREMSDASKAEMRQLLEQMVAMQQGQSAQQLSRETDDKDRTNIMFQQMMQMMAANTASLAGANRAAQEQTIDAHRMAAQQAQAMSERSMDTMSNVAATASRGPQQVFMDPRQRPPAAPPEPTRSEPSVRSGDAAPARGPAPSPKGVAAGQGAAPTSCVKCSAELEPGSVFCGACGSGQG